MSEGKGCNVKGNARNEGWFMWWARIKMMKGDSIFQLQQRQCEWGVLKAWGKWSMGRALSGKAQQRIQNKGKAYIWLHVHGGKTAG